MRSHAVIVLATGLFTALPVFAEGDGGFFVAAGLTEVHAGDRVHDAGLGRDGVDIKMAVRCPGKKSCQLAQYGYSFGVTSCAGLETEAEEVPPGETVAWAEPDLLRIDQLEEMACPAGYQLVIMEDGKIHDSELFSIPVKDLLELAWENSQIRYADERGDVSIEKVIQWKDREFTIQNYGYSYGYGTDASVTAKSCGEECQIKARIVLQWARPPVVQK